VVCHVWPGITPLNVWELPLPTWLRFAAEGDAWRKAQESNAKPKSR